MQSVHVSSSSTARTQPHASETHSVASSSRVVCELASDLIHTTSVSVVAPVSMPKKLSAPTLQKMLEIGNCSIKPPLDSRTFNVGILALTLTAGDFERTEREPICLAACELFGVKPQTPRAERLKNAVSLLDKKENGNWQWSDVFDEQGNDFLDGKGIYELDEKQISTSS